MVSTTTTRSTTLKLKLRLKLKLPLVMSAKAGFVGCEGAGLALVGEWTTRDSLPGSTLYAWGLSEACVCVREVCVCMRAGVCMCV
jgi:hypothetical protein